METRGLNLFQAFCTQSLPLSFSLLWPDLLPPPACQRDADSLTLFFFFANLGSYRQLHFTEKHHFVVEAFFSPFQIAQL